ncbi:MAG TPA: GDSL-type esterase/lipase family protein [Pseudolabrys sp.]|uniref:GDSL-type esterase/lipase family protein n=1 Tax=Pseudolabrys sp. TaxID=1960880 RepID=UPI002DDCAEB3|nr:GDSL-type esterase/lipase family protein [Pseudolabrys sp.]HEV2628802.1 GDSL-type esterase/lipase family protein [Pseudolabrys sp.]
MSLLRTLAALLIVVVGTGVFAAQAAPLKIVALGDSATAGWLVARTDAYPAELQRQLRAKGHDVVVKNAGISGDTSAGALHRLDLAVDPDTKIVLVEVGTNDLRLHIPAAKMRANVAEIVRVLQKRRIVVLLIGLGSLDLSGIARAAHVPYAQFRLPPGKYRARDHAHFNAEGYRIVVARMLPHVEALLAQIKASR